MRLISIAHRCKDYERYINTELAKEIGELLDDIDSQQSSDLVEIGELK